MGAHIAFLCKCGIVTRWTMDYNCQKRGAGPLDDLWKGRGPKVAPGGLSDALLSDPHPLFSLNSA